MATPKNELLWKNALKARDEITKQELKEIKDLYAKNYQWAKEQAEKFKGLPTKSAALESAYYENLAKQYKATLDTAAKQVEGKIVNNLYVVADEVMRASSDWLKAYGFNSAPLNFAVSNSSLEIVQNLVTGKVYDNGWNLSKSIWGDNDKTLKDIYGIIADGRAKNEGVYQTAKKLEDYVNPNRKKPWNLKMADGKTIYRGKVDYNAQRLVRTLNQHAYQQAVYTAAVENPFIEKIIWHANGSRACNFCIDMDGQEFEAKSTAKLPFDHPNGMCTLEPVPDKNIDKKLIDWLNDTEGKYPEIDNFASKYFGYKPLPKSTGKSGIDALKDLIKSNNSKLAAKAEKVEAAKENNYLKSIGAKAEQAGGKEFLTPYKNKSAQEMVSDAMAGKIPGIKTKDFQGALYNGMKKYGCSSNEFWEKYLAGVYKSTEMDDLLKGVKFKDTLKAAKEEVKAAAKSGKMKSPTVGELKQYCKDNDLSYSEILWKLNNGKLNTKVTAEKFTQVLDDAFWKYAEKVNWKVEYNSNQSLWNAFLEGKIKDTNLNALLKELNLIEKKAATEAGELAAESASSSGVQALKNKFTSVYDLQKDIAKNYKNYGMSEAKFWDKFQDIISEYDFKYNHFHSSNEFWQEYVSGKLKSSELDDLLESLVNSGKANSPKDGKVLVSEFKASNKGTFFSDVFDNLSDEFGDDFAQDFLKTFKAEYKKQGYSSLDYSSGGKDKFWQQYVNGEVKSTKLDNLLKKAKTGTYNSGSSSSSSSSSGFGSVKKYTQESVYSNPYDKKLRESMGRQSYKEFKRLESSLDYTSDQMKTLRNYSGNDYHRYNDYFRKMGQGYSPERAAKAARLNEAEKRYLDDLAKKMQGTHIDGPCTLRRTGGWHEVSQFIGAGGDEEYKAFLSMLDDAKKTGDLSKLDSLLDQKVKGGAFKYDSFTSTSCDVGGQWGMRSVEILYDCPNGFDGRPIMDLSRLGIGESECLLAPGHKVKINDFEFFRDSWGDIKLVIYATLIV